MGTSYPGGIDDFTEPSLPEETALKQAGSGTRNHVMHHRDLGDAIEAIQVHAAQKTHDHSGEDTAVSGQKLKQANTHEDADTDSSQEAIHHTIDPHGSNPNAAAAATHSHDYTSNRILNKPFEICTSATRPEPFDGKVIWEVDTHRMRVWAQFPGERQAVQGLYATDDFERSSNTSLGEDWDQWYLIGSGAGVMATPDGNAAAWIPESGDANRCIAQRINPDDRYTETYDQVITFTTNEHVANWGSPPEDNPTSNDVYFRMSDDGQEYVRAAATWWKGSTGAIMLLATTSGPLGEELIGQLPAKTNTPNKTWQFRMVGNRFEVYMGIQKVGEILDNDGLTMLENKGWGFGMQAGDRGSSQDRPNEVASITCADATYFTSSAQWQLLPVGDVPRVGLGAAAEQVIFPTGSIIEWDEVGEDNWGMFDPAEPTAVVIREAGVYWVHGSLVWGTSMSADRAAAVILVNNEPTVHQHWEFVRGNTYHPGFAQTVDVSAYVRLREGDRLGLAAAHNGSSSQHTGSKKTSEITQLSRFFAMFHSP